jgi:hypothetical protein
MGFELRIKTKEYDDLKKTNAEDFTTYSLVLIHSHLDFNEQYVVSCG